MFLSSNQHRSEDVEKACVRCICVCHKQIRHQRVGMIKAFLLIDRDDNMFLEDTKRMVHGFQVGQSGRHGMILF